MAIKLKVTPEKLRSTSNQFNGTNGQVQNTMRQIIAVADGLKTDWGGTAANTYCTKLRGLQNDTNRIHRMINEHITDLQKMAGIYDRAENDATSAAQPLKIDNIT